MTKDEKIDVLLNQFVNNTNSQDFQHVHRVIFGFLDINEYDQNYRENLSEATDLLNYMLNEGLLEKDGNTGYAKISHFGIKIHEFGGWLKYKEDIQKKESQIAEERRLQIDLAKSNIEANILNRKNAKINFWILIIGLIMNAIAIGLTIYNSIS